LDGTTGRALLTTGSKELAAFTAARGFAERFYARVLPSAEIVRHCRELGFPGGRLICMQGPFSREMNAATLRMTGAEYLVTKDTGARGGLPEKLEAAAELGVTVVLISRPATETGLTLEAATEVLTGVAMSPEDLEEVSDAASGAAFGAPRFPLFVELAGRSCVVVGGGTVGARRARVLREFGAAVTVVAPRLSERLDGVVYLEREYRAEDLNGAFLAVAATDDRAVNAAVAAACAARGIHVSAADAPGACSFWFPAVYVGRTVAGVVSRGGEHHLAAAAARRVREVLQELEVQEEEGTDS
jgi:precorrin-2 dehydrogenase/sirohydrochlorin ferrochelatase/precorrin-6A/cobalt-precorrin-6A reductase